MFQDPGIFQPQKLIKLLYSTKFIGDFLVFIIHSNIQTILKIKKNLLQMYKKKYEEKKYDAWRMV